MPTAPDPNSPFMDSRMQSLFGREPGTPSNAGMPTPQAASVVYPAPPAPATAQPGRPTNAVSPAPFGGFPPPPTPPPIQVNPTAPRRDPGRAPGRPVPTPTPPPIQPQPTAPRRDPGRAPVDPAAPRRDPGREPQPITPPLGVPGVDAYGQPTTVLSPEGQAQYQQAIVQKRRAFGPMPKVFATLPGLPPPPVELGKPHYNPFTGRWGQ